MAARHVMSASRELRKMVYLRCILGRFEKNVTVHGKNLMLAECANNQIKIRFCMISSFCKSHFAAVQVTTTG